MSVIKLGDSKDTDLTRSAKGGIIENLTEEKFMKGNEYQTVEYRLDEIEYEVI